VRIFYEIHPTPKISGGSTHCGPFGHAWTRPLNFDVGLHKRIIASRDEKAIRQDCPDISIRESFNTDTTAWDVQ
jgi:hypothetical protein